jgi:tRNA(adenine34) deaminase
MNNFTDFDRACMQEALSQAKHATSINEVPVGAVLAFENKVIARGYNQPISVHDPSAHAEIITLRAGGLSLQNYRLVNTTLYVTLEPCSMCLGAMIHARVKRVVFGAMDLKTGACGGAIDLQKLHSWNHVVAVEHGLLQAECASILQDFFKKRR